MKDGKNTNKQITRRELLGGAAAVTAFTIVPRHVLAASGTPAPSDKINMGAVGVGGNIGGVDLTRTNAGQNGSFAIAYGAGALIGASGKPSPSA